MPYKEPRVQLNLKLMPADYAALEAEAHVANTVVSRYARHLLLQRQAQPLSKAAYHERAEARRREAALHQQIATLQDQLRTLEALSADLARWRRRAQALEIELAQAQAEALDPTRLLPLIQRALDEQGASGAAKRAEEPAATASAGASVQEASWLTSRARRRTRRRSPDE
jgi:chromosome segregation ATPase